MKSETAVQGDIRKRASENGNRLFRNNSGQFYDERGIPVRFGLCNDSAAMNAAMKSSDLIGIIPVMITQDMVGKVIGQFCAVECKKEGWKYNPRIKREVAQKKFIDLINSLGGDARFASSVVDTPSNKL